MKWFRNMRIAAKLLAAFMVVTAVTAVTGVLGIGNTQSIHGDNTLLYKEIVQPLNEMVTLSAMWQRSRVVLRDVILMNDADKMNEEVDSLNAKFDNVGAAYEALGGFVKDEQIKGLLTDFKQKLDAYIVYKDQVLALALENKDVEAEELLQGATVDDAAGAVTDSVDALSTALKAAGSDAFVRNEARASSTTLWMVVLASVGVLLSIALGLFVASSISRPIRKVVEGANRLASGDTDVKLNVSSRDEIWLLAKAFDGVVAAIGRLVSDAGMLAEAAAAGELGARADASVHSGGYRQIVEGVNQTLDAVITPVNAAAQQLELIANGNDVSVIDADQFNGDFKIIATNLNKVRESLYALIDDSGMLARAAQAGDLSARADITRHKGGYADIIKGINDTLDAVVQPINEAASVLSEMAQGNLGVNVTGNYLGDHAVIKNAVNDTINTIKGYVGEISQTLTEMAGGDFSVGIDGSYRGDFGQIKDSINNIAESLSAVLGDISTAADQVASGTHQVSDGSQALSQGATEQASAIEELTASVTEIAGQTRQNALDANQANDLALAARTNADDGNNRMKEMQQAMSGINEASASISKIIKVIDEIAFQTNLLALNAAVEAARAGQHGKGFAVVAEEVRSLAQRSAAAAKETTAMIEESIKQVKSGTKMADETAEALNRIVEGVEKATDLMGGIAKASNDQATAVAQVNRGIEQVSMVVQTNSATAEQSAAASEELSSQAQLLKEMVGRFTLHGQSRHNPARAAVAHLPEPRQSARPKIALNDHEFGKY